jgi:hypothetical protein
LQYRPTAFELLDTIASLLETDVLPAVDGSLQHRVRVAANLARILEREARLAPANEARERESLARLLGHHGPLPDLRAELAERLRTGGDEPVWLQSSWDALVAICRDDLAIAKPGHDGWEGT